MYAYNKFWKSTKAMLLYPGESELNDFKPFRNPDEEELSCKMHFLSIDDLFKLKVYQKIIEEMVG